MNDKQLDNYNKNRNARINKEYYQKHKQEISKKHKVRYYENKLNIHHQIKNNSNKKAFLPKSGDDSNLQEVKA